MTGLDYSAARISGWAIRAAGYTFVIRYAGTPGRTKNITPAEYADLTAAGVQVWLVFENGVDDILGGYAGGVAAARAVRADANAVGYPAGAPIFLCADRHLTNTEIPAGVAYLRGAAAVLGVGAVGAYGFSEFINAVRAAGAASYFWQCGSRFTVDAGVHIYQRNTGSTYVGGIDCDINDLLLPLTPPPPAEAPHPPEDDDMIYIKMGDGTLHNTRYATLLSSGLFIEWVSDGEKASAEDVIQRQHAGVVQYAESARWAELAAASAKVFGTPV